MKKIIDVKSLPDKKIFVKYSDGMEGKISLEKLTTREEYETLQTEDIFSNIKVDGSSGDIVLNDNIELCKNAVYGILELKKQMANIGLSMDD